MAGTWDRHHDGLCVFPTSFRSCHGTHFTRCSKYVERSNEKWTSDSSSFQSFYGRHHHSRPSQIAADGLLQRYHDLFTWARMKAKPKKSRSLSFVGGSVREIHFKIGDDKIPTVRKKPVKSLGRLYSIPLTDRHRGTEVQKIALKGLKSIDKTCLPGKMKARCYQHVTNMVCDISCSAPNILTGRRIQNWESTPSHDDEGLMMMKDEIIRKAYLEIKSGTKWSAVKTTQEAECSLRIKDIIGITQINRAGLGSTCKKVFSKVDPKGKRDMVSEEFRMFEEEQRKASAITQVKQCALTKWNDIEPIRLSWKSLLAMEPLAISFLLRSFDASISWWSFFGAWVIASFQRSPEHFWVFWLITPML